MINSWITEISRRILIAVVLLAIWTSMEGEALGAVLVSEVLPDPATDWSADGLIDARGDEWVEVVNTGPGAIDLSGYWLRDALGTAPQIRLSGLLEDGATALFTGDDAVAWQEASGEGSAGLSLNNSGDTLELFFGHPEGGGERVDVVIYGAHVGEDDRSVARFLPQNEWILCDGLNPYNGSLEPVGSGCPPTPGEVNFCEGLVPAESVTWSDVKTRWR